MKAEEIGGEREGDFMDNFNGNHQFLDSELFSKNQNLWFSDGFSDGPLSLDYLQNRSQWFFKHSKTWTTLDETS